MNPLQHTLAVTALSLFAWHATASTASAPPAPKVLLVVSGEGRVDAAGKTLRPGFEMEEFAQAWLVFKANGLQLEVASPAGGAVVADRHDPAEAARARAWYDEARSAYLREGYPPYRATSISMPGAMDSNPVARDVLAALKSAIDPQNLVAPGRYGTPLRGTAPR